MGLFDLFKRPKNESLAVRHTEIDQPSANDGLAFPDWYVSVSFGKSSSANYLKAVTLAKSAPQYHEQYDDGNILHQAIYSAEPNEYLAFIMLYELVKDWKSSFAIINGNLVDRKIIGQINYCYGDKCRSGNGQFCYGASWATENPFGCHRIQISTGNHPWWTFYSQVGNKFILDKNAILQRIESIRCIYSLCPAFDYDSILRQVDKLPRILTSQQMAKLKSSVGLVSEIQIRFR